MEKPKKRHLPRSTKAPRPGEIARAGVRTLTSYRVAALPIINHVLERMRLEQVSPLVPPTPPIDAAGSLPSIGISLLLKNVLLAREPLYGIGEWAAKFDPNALGFTDDQLPSLNDDRVGRCLDCLFRTDITSMVLALATHVVQEFQVDLDELHNDSTTITFHGEYADAATGRKAGQTDPDGDHLGLQQGPSARPQATTLHPHSGQRRRGPFVFPGRQRQRGGRQNPYRHLGPPLPLGRTPELPVRGRLQTGLHGKHGPYPSTRRPVPHRASPDAVRGQGLPGLARQGSGRVATHSRQAK